MAEDDDKPPTRGDARRRAMMDAAWAAVLEKGFSDTTLNDIIVRSGGSKATLYDSFGGKDSLLGAVMQEKCDAFSDQLSVTLKADRDPRETLHRFAETLADEMVRDEVIRFVHLLMTQGHLFPALTQRFTSGGPQRSERDLSRYLADAAARGRLAIADPEQAANLLLSMIIGRWTQAILAHTLSGPALAAHREKVRRLAVAAVDLFLDGALPRRTADTASGPPLD